MTSPSPKQRQHTLKRILKWEPQISLEDGLARTYAWIEGELKNSSIPAAATG
jgi:nucleoside-diphosphate-sugar epimerase